LGSSALADSRPSRSARSIHSAGACWPSIGRGCPVMTMCGPSRPKVSRATELPLTASRRLSLSGHQLRRPRAGLAGERSGLWFEFARIGWRDSTALRRRGERHSAACSRAGPVLGTLAALGYDAEWQCIPASAVGAPHIRDRLWIIAYPNGEQHESTSAAIEWARPRDFLVPTPVSDDTGWRRERYPQGGTALSTATGGPLNPQWIEWLMGFPAGWTDLSNSETP
jgi:hypothetical protein